MKSFRTFFLGPLFLLLVLGAWVWRGDLTQALFRLRLAFKSAGDASFSYEAFNALKVENEALRAELLNAADALSQSPRSLSAHVYSRYPFNDKSLLVIDKGSDAGVKVGMPVLLKEGALVGRVSAVLNTQSEVETIFHPEWKSGVSLGNEAAHAVLRGGNTLRLELIPNDKEVHEGDVIKNISPEFPYGLFIGEVGILSSSSENTWREGIATVPFKEENIQEVLVLTHFP